MNESRSIIHLLGIKLGIYLAAVAAAYILAAVSATQSVVSSLAGMGVGVSWPERLAMTVHDLGGMAGMFLPLIALGFLLAFLSTALLCRWWGRWRFILYPVAGAAAVASIHLLLHFSFGITPVAIARSSGGLVVQALAGAVGGLTYIGLTRRFAPAVFDDTPMEPGGA